MSLIVDALKKAQQLRSKESKGPSYPALSSDRKESLKALKKRWTMIGIGLAILVILFLISGRIVSSPSPSIPVRTPVRIEKKASVPVNPVRNYSRGDSEPSEASNPAADQKSIISKEVNDEEPREPLKNMMSLPKDVMGLSKDVMSLPKEERLKVHPFVSALPSAPKEEKTPVKQAAVPLSPAPSREKAPAKSIEVKQEADKDQLLASVILTHFNQGVQFHNQGEFSKSIQAYHKVIELDPTYIEAYNNLGIVYQERGDFDNAFKALKKSIEINPRYEKGHNNLGILLFLEGRNEEALEAFQKSLAINPHNIESYVNLGVLFKRQGQLNKAIESYQKALDINPLHGEVHYNIALLFEQMRNFDLAIGHYNQFINLSSSSQSDLVAKVQRHVDDLIKEMKKK
jgi:Flp pilus assembly protein TadD